MNRWIPGRFDFILDEEDEDDYFKDYQKHLLKALMDYEDRLFLGENPDLPPKPHRFNLED